MIPLADRINELVSAYGSLNKAARSVGINAGYLSQLRSGKKTAPSQSILLGLGVRRIVKILYVKEFL